MVFDVFVSFNGNCKEAVEYYAKIFGQEVPKMMLYGDAPATEGYEVKESDKNRICYTSLKIGNNNVMFSDNPSDMEAVIGSNITLSIGSDDTNEVETLYNQLIEGGEVIMPLGETFWSNLYGMVTDKFGIMWQVCIDKEDFKM